MVDLFRTSRRSPLGCSALKVFPKPAAVTLWRARLSTLGPVGSSRDMNSGTVDVRSRLLSAVGTRRGGRRAGRFDLAVISRITLPGERRDTRAVSRGGFGVGAVGSATSGYRLEDVRDLPIQPLKSGGWWRRGRHQVALLARAG